MSQVSQNIFYKYTFSMKILFFIFLFGVLSFGRAFSVIHIDINNFPVFVTELFLLLSFPLLLIRFKDLLKLPKIFLTVSFFYFLFGIIYLCIGVLDGNLFAFRDFIVLCGYAMFFPFSFICFNKVRIIKMFIFIILASNVIAILIGRMLILNAGSFYPFSFLTQIKTYQLGIIYGFGSVFMLVFYDYLKDKICRFFILVLVSVNLYMLVVFGVRSAWVAFISLIIFLALILGFRNVAKVYFKLLVVFMIVGTSLSYVDFEVFKSSQLDTLTGKSKGMVRFINDLSGSAASMDSHIDLSQKGRLEKAGYDNIVWREKIWKQTIDFTAGSYLLGKGFGNYPRYNILGYRRPCIPFENSNIIPTHNHFLSVFYKMGFVGFGLFLFINFYVFYYALKYLGECRDVFISLVIKSSLGALLFWHIMALFFDVIDSPPTSVLLWIFTGLVFAAVGIDKKQEGGYETQK